MKRGLAFFGDDCQTYKKEKVFGKLFPEKRVGNFAPSWSKNKKFIRPFFIFFP